VLGDHQVSGHYVEDLPSVEHFTEQLAQGLTRCTLRESRESRESREIREIREIRCAFSKL
jgi:hypothetical protein